MPRVGPASAAVGHGLGGGFGPVLAARVPAETGDDPHRSRSPPYPGVRAPIIHVSGGRVRSGRDESTISASPTADTGWPTQRGPKPQSTVPTASAGKQPETTTTLPSAAWQVNPSATYGSDHMTVCQQHVDTGSGWHPSGTRGQAHLMTVNLPLTDTLLLGYKGSRT